MARWLGDGLSTYLLHPLHGDGYQWWSGLGSDLGYAAILIAVLRRFNCHAKGCWRVGGHPVEGTPYRTCRRHHPGIPRRAPSAEEIADASRAEGSRRI